MRVMAELSVIPIGVGPSLSQYIAECERILEDAGLEAHIHATGTDVVGEWDDVLQAIRRCHERVHEMGAPRINTNVTLSTRTDGEISYQQRIDSVQAKVTG